MHDTLFSFIGRLALVILSLLVCAAAVLVVASAIGVVPVGQLQVGSAVVTVGLADLPLANRFVWGGGGVVIALTSIVLLTVFSRSGRRRGGVLLSSGRRRGMLGGGTLEVSARSLHALATYSCERVDGVLEAFTRLKLKRDGWHADIDLVLNPRAKVREVAEGVKTAVEDALRNHTSISVTRLRLWAQLDPLAKKRRVY